MYLSIIEFTCLVNLLPICRQKVLNVNVLKKKQEQLN